MTTRTRGKAMSGTAADPSHGEGEPEWGSMDRRGFMKFLSALGVTISIAPHPLAKAPAGGFQDDGKAKLEPPLVFELEDEYGVMEVAGMVLPRTRGDCLGIDPPATAEQMIALASEHWRVQDLLAGLYLEAHGRDFEDPGKVDERVWRKWIHRPRNTISTRRTLAAWLEDTILNEFDTEYANDHGATPQGAALSFWQCGFSEYEGFDVVFLEGSIPGSGIVAARLDMPVADANRLAISQNLPIRFVLASPPRMLYGL